jgi:hypothetical protein
MYIWKITIKSFSFSLLVANLLFPFTVLAEQDPQETLNVHSSFEVTDISCTSSTNTTKEITANIERLGKMAIQGDRIAANTLVSYSRKGDGYVSQKVSQQLFEWAKSNPSFLINVLDQQPENVRLNTLIMLDFGFDTDSKARQEFGANITNFSANSPTVRAWRSRSFERNNP